MYLEDILNKYSFAANDLKNKQLSYEYSDGVFYNSMGEDYKKYVTHLQWGSNIEEDTISKVKFLDIKPPLEYLFPQYFPDFIYKAARLEILKLPLVYAINNDIQKISSNLTKLVLVNDKDQTDNLGETKKERIQRLLLSEIVIPNLEGLSLLTLSSASMIADGFLNVSDKQFPNLKFLRFIPNAKDKYCLLDNFSILEHLWISLDKGIDIFQRIKSPLKSLYIDGAGSDLKMSNIDNVPTLEVFAVNSSYNVVNCDEFYKIPLLKELKIMNSNFIENVEALLQMPNLKRLEIIDCKGAMTEKQKKLFNFNKDKFDKLSIDFA